MLTPVSDWLTHCARIETRKSSHGRRKS